MATETKLRAFHGHPAIKAKYLARVRAHRAADELIRGTGWDGHRGCAVGCTLDRYDHAAYETELGIPAVIAHLEDAIFEGLPLDQAMEWPERFLAAIKPGTDLSFVSAHFFVWLLETELAKWSTQQSRAVVALYLRRIAGDEPTTHEWAAAAWAAWAAAEREAGAACYSRMADKLIEILEGTDGDA